MRQGGLIRLLDPRAGIFLTFVLGLIAAWQWFRANPTSERLYAAVQGLVELWIVAAVAIVCIGAGISFLQDLDP